MKLLWGLLRDEMSVLRPITGRDKMKIAVIGYSGAGKSTLARALGEVYHCPVLHLDMVQFSPGWAERDREEARAIVAAFMEQEDWVIDGNYTGLYQGRRLDEADLIFFLDFSRTVCLRQAIGRYRFWRGKTRDDMAAGCNEKLDLEFIWWILRKGRTHDRKARFQGILKQYPEKVTVFKTRRETDRYLQQLMGKGL